MYSLRKNYLNNFLSLIVCLLCITNITRAQINWQQTNGPCGASVYALETSGTNLFAAAKGNIYLSTNNGSSWSTVNTGLDNYNYTSIVVSGANIFVGSLGGGVLYSSNNGLSWTQANNGLAEPGITALAVSGTNLFAGTVSSGVFLSTNNGANWSEVNNGLTKNWITAFAVSGTDLFVSNGNSVFLSTNNGSSWSEVNTGLTSNSVFSFAVSGSNVFAGTGNGGIFLSSDKGSSWIAVNTGLNHNTVMALAATGTDLYAGTGGGSVFKSTNNGLNWSLIGTDMIYTIRTLKVAGTNIFVGTDGGNGITMSTNSGVNWNAANDGLIGTCIRSSLVSGKNLFIGTYDCGAFLSTNNGSNWTSINTGLMNYEISAFAVLGTNLFAGTDNDVFLSTNDGASWNTANNGLPSTHISSLVTSGTDIFAGTSEGVFLSTDNGSSWSSVSTGLTNLAIQTLAVSGTSLIAGTSQDGVFISTNNGASWSTSIGLAGVDIYSFAVSGTNIFAGTNHGVFLSTNSGLSWYAVNAGINSEYIYSLAVSGTNIFAGCDKGVFLSTNMGASWNTVNTGLTNTNVLTLNISDTYLFAGTNGGGVFIANISQSPPTNNLIAYYPFSGNANDESGNGNNPVNVNATLTSDRFGNSNNAYSFDGVDDFIDLGDILDDTFCKDTAQFSISGWAFTNNYNPVEGNLIIGKSAGGSGPYQWSLSHNYGTIRGQVFTDASAGSFLTQQTTLNTNEWFHFVLIFDGKKDLSERIQLYINNTLSSSGSIVGTPKTGTENTGLHLTIGGQNYFSSPQSLYNGLIDDIRIYNKALTKEEIDTLYSEESGLIVNYAPIANAGPDQTCLTDSISGVWVNLDGTGSFDANEDTLSYTWTEKDSLLATGVKPFVFLQPGIHNIHLIVNDGKSGSDTDLVVISIYHLADRLVACYPFNGNANDESGNGNNAIYINATLTSDRFGKDSSAYYFDGVNNYIDFGDILDDVFCKDIAQFSISGWAKTEVMGNVHGEGNLIIGKTAGGIGPYQWSVSHNSGMLFGGIFSDSALSNYRQYYLPMNANNWFHFVLIFDGTQPAENRMRVIVNNNSSMQYWSGAGTLGTGTENTSLHMYIGGQTHYFNTLQSRYNGTIDDIRIYDRVLAGEEIQNLFLEGGWDPVNSEPIADAGPDQIAYIDSASFAIVTLDGSASSDEDRDTLTYTWKLADNTLATGVNPTIQLPLGSHTITLIVSDKKGGLDMDQVVITVYNIPKVRVAFALNVGGPVYAGISALGDNAIYAVASGDAIYKMNTTGNVAYTIQVAGDIRSSSSIAYDTTVYIGSSDKNLYAFSKEGNSVWPPLPTGGLLTATPTIDSVLNRIYIGVSNKNFIAVNRLTGTVEWNFFTDDQIWNSAVITKDRKLVFATQRGTLYGFNLNNPTSPAAPTWQISLPGEAPSSIALDNEGYIYIGTGSGSLLKISLPDGQQPSIEWQTELDGSISGSPVIDGTGTIYVGSSDANLYAIDNNSGEIKWTFSTNGGIRSTPAISEAGNIYIANDIGEIISLDRDKNINWYYKISSAVVAPLTYYKSTLYIGTLGNQVIALCDAADSVQARYLLKSAAEAVKKPIWATFQGNNQRTGMFTYSSTGSTEIANPHFNLPTEYSLSQNYPNPFNPSTTIRYTMPEEGRVSIKIYNIIGKHIATIVDGYQQAGYHTAVFNMDNYASGVYFYQMRTGSFTDTKKMIIMK